jgi:hypothetical protein
MWTSIPHAHEYWRSSRRLPDPPSNLEAAEAFILNEPPVTAQDAVCILDVVCAYGDDVRCDGLDRAALARVRHLLSAMA